ncbi:MAG: GH3 auxin-responsive promoter family protein [Bacteroidales bacterium]|nr:GH3 auxin-responsive promoter family protein [Bacteroidales bacterium]
MSFISSVISWYFKTRFSQIDRFIQDPVGVQRNTLSNLLRAARDTEWGKKHAYSGLLSYDDFREQVPLQDYQDIKPYVDRLIRGEQNLLWPSKIQWFAKSSGTTGDRSKFIPISRESLAECHYKAGKDVLSIYCTNHPDSKIFDGKGLIMGGSHSVSELNNKAYFGDLSAVLLQNAPFYSNMHRIPKLSVALLADWEEKLNKLAHSTCTENVTNISGVPSWNLLLLKKILEITGRKHLLEVWPNLELFIHGGVNFSPYRKQFEQIIPSKSMRYLETYNASEGFFGIQDNPEAQEMLLMLDYGIFYEFIPMDEFGEDQSKTVTLEDVDTDTHYAMIISTNAGLWRYIIGDTIRFTSLNPFRIRIAGRTKSFINAFGEELIVDNTDSALQEACKETGAIITEYTAAPVYLNDKESAAHEYLIEFEKEPDDLQSFIQHLDDALKKLNSDYEAKRSGSILLKMPKITSLPEQTFYNWLKSKGKIGGQNKVPRLFNDRKYVDDIMAFIKQQR